ncbi:hypothetical protein SAMN04488020_104196 [Palleronia marisminoris]|uniref:HdeA/HdeB family protein n=1 Tax=Palleronia marisminoris TaxID=315423 RepID=A0A1Y5SLK0_9RHOB|nr:hypothetical protein [Palleronia marisminoris]SFG85344.1 hypothetical protein SAMN04488020_104196 [Palleronia marisminoris]SLN42414.1 hypothetical protein PAM7066_01818 [Palleronia marisminoris]
MKPSSLGTLSAAILSLAAPTALSAQTAGGNDAMTDITCEAFLDLPASDQEMHATALTTARMDAAMPPSDTDATGEDTAEAEPDDAEAPSESAGTPTDGMMSNILSPTVVALVTICENTVSDGTGAGTVSESDTGALPD